MPRTDDLQEDVPTAQVPPPCADTVLWNRFREGSTEAFNAIYHQYVRLLYNYGRKISPNGALVEDCIQDLFVELWQKKHLLSQTTSIKFYLFKSLNRKIVRRVTQEERLGLRQDISEEYAFEVEFSPEMHLIADQITEEQKNRLTQALQALTPRQKEAIFLKFYEHLSFEEIADILSINLKATYKLVARALDTLRHFLKQTPFFLVALLCLGFF